MPNWCYNKLQLKGDEDQIKKFKKKADTKKKPLSLENFIPTPEELLDKKSPMRDKEIAEKMTKKYGSKDWYDWRLDNWGVKWDVRYCDLMDETNTYFFETPWTTPTKAFLEISKDYKDVRFILAFSVEGMFHDAEKLVIKDGNIIEEFALPDNSEL